jgi:serine/threonine-protein kinase RsbW
VRGAAEKHGFPDDAITDIELGTEEVCSNVIDYSLKAGERGTIKVICARVPLGIKIIIKEKGMPFDPTQIPEYDPEAELDEIDDDALRMFLARKMMDQISFHNLGPRGRETHLLKHFPGKTAEESFPSGVVEREEVPERPQVIKERIAYDVRKLEPAEAIEVSKCAYKSHGYTFFDEHIYYPERIVELNKSGMMLSAVAVTKDNLFMGHSALVLPHAGARIAELTFVFVNVEYRGQGCMTRLCEHLFNLAPKKKLVGIYAYAVTNHVFTQKVMLKYGFHDCGILLATSPATWVFKGIAGDNTQRISVALSFKYLTEPPPVTLYFPARHRKMLERIYANIKGTHPCAVPPDSEAELPLEESTIEVELFPSENCAEIYMVKYGVDAVPAMKKILRNLCVKKIASMTLCLSLEDPKTYFLASEFERMGFFFAGILPGSKVGDALLLQYLNNVELDYDKILAYTDMAKEILAYVKKSDPNILE